MPPRADAERRLECLRLAVELAKANGSVWNPQATVLAAGRFRDFVEGGDAEEADATE